MKTKPTNTIEEKLKFKDQLSGQEALMSKRQLERIIDRFKRRDNPNVKGNTAIYRNGMLEMLEIVKQELSK